MKGDVLLDTLNTAQVPGSGAEVLRRNSLPLRWPALMDELMEPATQQAELVAQFARPVSLGAERGRVDILDLGCGTGRLAGALAVALPTVRCTGVDWQRQLIEYAEHEYPEAVYHVADLRTVRLPTSYDVIVCTGNTLAHLSPKNSDLHRACDTFAAHARPGSTLLIETMTQAVPSPKTKRILAPKPGLLDDPVELCTFADVRPDGHQTLHREWTFAHGPVLRDQLDLWAHNAAQIAAHLAEVGFARHSEQGTFLAFTFAGRAAR